MSAMTQGYSFSPANSGGPQIGFGPAPIEQNPMDQYGNPAPGGMPTQFVSASPQPQTPPGFQTSWEMAGYPSLEAWKSATGGTGGAQMGFGPAPLSVNPTPAPAGGKSGSMPNPTAQQYMAPIPTASAATRFRTGLTPPPRNLQPQSVNTTAPNRYTRTRTRPINTSNLRPGFY